MAGINNINLAMGASSFGAYNQKLTNATKAKLEELGIVYNKNITEAQAQQMIRKFELAKEQENQSLSNKDQNQSSQAKDDNKEKLISLAKKIGISVDEKASFQEISNMVEAGLEEKIQASSNNKNELLELKSLSRELASIQAQAQGANTMQDGTNQALMMSLEMLSLYNKNFLQN